MHTHLYWLHTWSDKAFKWTVVNIAIGMTLCPPRSSRFGFAFKYEENKSVILLKSPTITYAISIVCAIYLSLRWNCM